MENHGNVVFAPRKTGSYSIVKSWSKVSTPVLHTHDLLYFVVVDKKNSQFHEFLMKNFPKYVSFYSEDGDIVHYSIIVKNINIRNQILGFFQSYSIVTSIRDPLTRRISQLLQSLTVEQINAVMDGTHPTWKRLELKTPRISEICEIYKKTLAARKWGCSVTKDAMEQINKDKKLLSVKSICRLFHKHFVAYNSLEFTEFFGFMQGFVDPDFDFEKIRSNGYDFQEYKILGKNTRHMIVKLEDLSKNSVTDVLKEFTGIKSMGREHNSVDSHHLISVSLKEVKNGIIDKFKSVEFNKKDSLEGQLSTGFGY